MILQLHGQFGGGGGEQPIVTAPTPQLSGEAKASLTTITWNNTGADSYVWQIADNIDFTNPTQASGTDFSEAYVGLSPNAQYYFRVRALLNGVYSEWGSISFYVNELISISVSNLSASVESEQSVLTWTNPSAGFSTLTVERSTDGSNYTTLNAAVSETTYTATGLTNGTLYYFRVTPNVNDVDYTASAAVRTVTPQANVMPTPTLNAISDNNDGTGSIAVNVTSPTADSYEFTINGIIQQDTASATWSFSGLSQDTILNYSIVAKKAGYTNSAPLTGSVTIWPTSSSETIESYGGTGDGAFYFGNVNYTPSETTTLVELTGGETWPIDVVGKTIVTNRIHLNTYAGQNDESTAPNRIGCRYGTVLTRISDTEITIDKVINGGNATTPQATTAQDCYIFTDNKDAFNAAGNDVGGSNTITLQDDKVYIFKGYPNISYNRPITFTRDGLGTNKPILMFSVEDALYGNERGAAFPEYIAIFNSLNVFNSFGNDNDITLLNIDVCPTIYTFETVQYGRPQPFFFAGNDASTSTLSATRKIVNSDWSRVKQLAIAALGVERSGMTFSLPQLSGAIKGGGTIVGDDIGEMLTYELVNTEWRADSIHNLKNDTKAGTLFKVNNDTPLELREVLDVKPTSFSGVTTRFRIEDGTGHTLVETDNFSFYQTANQDWGGGTSTNYKTYNQIEIDTKPILYFQNNADFVEFQGGGGISTLLDTTTARMFDKIPEAGDTFGKWQSGYTGTGTRGVVQKISPTVWYIWGYHVTAGDVLQETVSGTTATVLSATQYVSATKPTGATRTIHPFVVTFDVGIDTDIDLANFVYVTSQTESLLSGDYNARHYVNRDEVGHLFYMNGGVNIWMRNVKTYGYWRSSSNATGTPTNLYKAAKIAYFENVEMYGGGISNEWSPSYMRYREDLGDTSARIKIVGGKPRILQPNNNSYPRVEFSGDVSPLVYCRVNNPIINEGATVRFPQMSIYMYDARILNLDNCTNVSGTIYFYTNGGGATLNNAVGTISNIGTRRYLTTINSSANITITGNNVDVPIFTSNATEESLTCLITNHSGNGDHYTNKRFVPNFTPVTYPDATLSITNTLGEVIAPNT